MYPIKANWRLSSNYGKRADPFTGVSSFHTGIDMAVPMKTPVYASADGTVKTVSWSNVYGNYIIISHADGYQTLYAHLYSASAKQGQKVTQGTKIGLVGNTGYSSVFSLSEISRGVTLKGLMYTLEKGELRNDFPLGVSNEFIIDEEASVSVEDGTLLIILQFEQ